MMMTMTMIQIEEIVEEEVHRVDQVPEEEVVPQVHQGILVHQEVLVHPIVQVHREEEVEALQQAVQADVEARAIEVQEVEVHLPVPADLLQIRVNHLALLLEETQVTQNEVLQL
jgi:hypothetical protein